MAVRTITVVCALSALLAGSAIAAERTGALPKQATAAESLPVATDVRLGGDDKQTRFVVDLT